LGDLELSSGADTFKAGLSSTVSDVLLDGPGSLTLTANQSYAGFWSQTGGTLSLGGFTLTETGTTNLDGGGVNGPGSWGEQRRDLGLGLGRRRGAERYRQHHADRRFVSRLRQQHRRRKADHPGGASFNIADNTTISGGEAATLSNTGKLVKQSGGGVSTVGVATINTGAITVDSGTMSFLSTVSGDGSFVADASTTLKFGAAVSGGGKVTLGSFANLFVQATAGFGDTIAGFAAGNIIEMAGFGFTGSTLSFNTAADQLTIRNGSATSTLQFTGTYAPGSFRLFSDSGVAAIAHT
jgi:hypothetical protein